MNAAFETTSAMLREEVRQLLDELPEDDLTSADIFLRWLTGGRKDPLLVALATAPFDDEPLAEEDEAAVKEMEEEVRAGTLIPHEEIRRRYLD